MASWSPFSPSNPRASGQGVGERWRWCENLASEPGLPAVVRDVGGVAERFNAPVLKTGVRKDSWVRIPPPPFLG